MAQERVAAALLAEGGFRTMAGDEDRVVAHGPQPLSDGVHQLRMVAAGKVGAADGAGEEHVAHQGQLARAVEEDHVARGVAGAVQHLQGLAPHLHAVAALEPAVRGEAAHVGEAEHFGLLGHAVDPEPVVHVGPFHRNGQLGRQFGDAAGMVDVAVGHQDLFQGDAVLLGRGQDAGQVAPRVHRGSPHGLGAPQQGAVLFEGSDRDDGVVHGASLVR